MWNLIRGVVAWLFNEALGMFGQTIVGVLNAMSNAPSKDISIRANEHEAHVADNGDEDSVIDRSQPAND